MSLPVREWLDGVKPGYGELYASAFSEMGFDDAGDFGGIAASEMTELEIALEELGAKTVHLRNIRNAIAEEGIKLKPHQPGGPSRSHPSPQVGRRLGGTEEAGAPLVEWTRRDSGKQFSCFISHHKRDCAMEARFLKEKMQRIIGKECFLDSDDLRVRAFWRVSIIC
jgi:hypothetical protein